jgi:hypothetical protein
MVQQTVFITMIIIIIIIVIFYPHDTLTYPKSCP